ncbi:SusD/RagB family nutrient-binding outer membrane lipoprotein [Flavobacteriaceae bacterium]|nr:SusD/RagB family nutrient-binding outer membrane lipoprotein [Flavobacteriaceae bacterium]
MKNILKITFVTAILALFTGCETTELDLLDNPNAISADVADKNFVLNQIQLSFNGIVSGFRGSSSNITRMTAQFGQYNGTIGVNSLNGTWASAYNMFANVDLLETISGNTEGGLPNHVGVAQIIEAYTYITLVDYVGDVPYSQANQFGEFPTPVLDPGEDVYTAQIALLNTAISNLNQGSAVVPQDLFYGDFDADNWIAVANTLKLKAHLNMGDGAAISGLLSKNIIDTDDEDFQFNYSSSASPESRSPIFQGNYPNGAGFYMSNGFLDMLNAGDGEAPFVETGIADPRLRYYVYRQRSSEPSGSDLPCAGQDIYDYCYVGNLYWGRDHGDDEGIPNDNTKRTTWGVYPGGGAFDNNQFNRSDSSGTPTLDGAGINPIFLSSFTHFALAEAGLDLGVGVNSRDLLEAGISLSMDKVTNFTGSLDTTDEDDETLDYAATGAEISAYIARVMAEYDAASGNDAKLEIVVREWYLASWGNGVEPYNMYRRTGYPTLQTGVKPVGPFPRSYRYPETETNTNPNISQTTADNQVFWDTNPAGFIN